MLNTSTNKSPLVSVIIPCYNGELFVKKSILSVLQQTHKEIEIIVVNDGSKDNTYDEINSINSPLITLINKPNTGVSDSRNIGLKYAKGQYLLFLDADDILEFDFLEKRLEILENNKSLDYCTGEIVWIDEKDQLIAMPKKQFGIYENTILNVVAFNSLFSTCPSAYLFRASTVKKKSIQFNTKISSPADRFFLLEFGYGTTSGFVKNGGKLFYRINTQSMSHLFSKKLIFDQENYFYEVLKNKLLRPQEKAILVKKMSYLLFASFLKLKMYRYSLLYLFKYLKSFFW